MIKSVYDLNSDLRSLALQKAKEELKIREDQLKKVDELSNDVRHMFEDPYNKLNAAEWYMLSKAFQKVLRTRRVIKKRIIVINTLIDCLKDVNTDVGLALTKANEQEKKMEGGVLQYYRLRFLKSKDLRRNPIMKQVDDALERLKLTEIYEEYEREYKSLLKK